VNESYVAEAERIAAARGNDPEWMVRARRAALERFAAAGFPTTRDEEWRFTSVAPIADARFALAVNGASAVRAADLARLAFPGDLSASLVFVNGRLAPSLSTLGTLPSGVRVESFEQAVKSRSHVLEAHVASVAAEGHPFTALNTAFLSDGALVHLPEAAVAPAPVHLLFLTTGEAGDTMAHPRVLIVLSPSSQASIVESHAALSGRGSFTNAVTEIVAKENSILQHYKIQRDDACGGSSFHVGGVYVHAARDAKVTCHSITLGGSLVRNDTAVVLDGEGGHCTLNGLYVADRDRLVDNHTTIDHARPHCDSREVYRGILADRARAVFNGKIIVRKDAQKTDAKQTSKALLLSEDARINTKPQLEIFANDVKCTHGAAVGQLDDEAIFYLRARGVGEAQARHILMRAFAADVLQRIPIEGLAARLDAELAASLPERPS
jgi:Fe-S cluster assembly protein SufD